LRELVVLERLFCASRDDRLLRMVIDIVKVSCGSGVGLCF
jgi:hypothetical protein